MIPDTMRRSITSGKSVSIHPSVTEYHYDNAREMVAAHNHAGDSPTSDYCEASVPPPIFPRSRKLPSDQLMDNYQDFIL